MSDTPPQTPPQDPGPAAPPPRRLTRSSSDRIIGGVAGGLGRHLGVDPILVRVAFVVLTFAGGAGVLAYLALLAFVPTDGGVPAEGGGGGSSRAITTAGTIALAIAAVVVLGPPVVVLGPGLLVLALLAVVAVLVVRAAGGSGDPGRTAARAGLLVLVLLASAGAAVGVAVVAALGGGTVIAVLTVVAGLALVGAAFVGGARWLIVPALVLALPLAIVAAGDIDIEGGVGDRTYRPHGVEQVQPVYKLGMGDMAVDLRDVDFPSGRTDVRVQLGVGSALVLVPEDVCVTSDVEVSVGTAEVFDHVNDGVDVAYAEGGDPGSRPHVHLDADLGAGELRVRRAGGLDEEGWMDDAPLDRAGCA
jgi:phage shock protein PspC (stress-responsive transcriptional regulator)